MRLASVASERKGGNTVIRCSTRNRGGEKRHRLLSASAFLVVLFHFAAYQASGYVKETRPLQTYLHGNGELRVPVPEYAILAGPGWMY